MAKGKMGGRSATNQKYERTLNKIVKQTANLKKEQYRIIDAEGNVVFTKQGEKHAVATTVGEKREFVTKGSVTIHNHPAGGTFSSEDFEDFGFGAREVVVAAPEGVYRLLNKNYGTKKQYDGWIGLREGARKIADQEENRSSLYYRDKAGEMLKNSTQRKAMERLTNQYIKEKNAGASKEKLDSIYRKYEKASAEYTERRKKLERELEVAPYHEYYKKHAKDFGFAYSFTKAKKRK